MAQGVVQGPKLYTEFGVVHLCKYWNYVELGGGGWFFKIVQILRIWDNNCSFTLNLLKQIVLISLNSQLVSFLLLTTFFKHGRQDHM